MAVAADWPDPPQRHQTSAVACGLRGRGDTCDQLKNRKSDDVLHARNFTTVRTSQYSWAFPLVKTAQLYINGEFTPAEASAELDVRFATAAQAKTIEERLLSIVSDDPRVKVRVSGSINRPPLERTEQVLELYELARNIAGLLDFELGETQVGGASDGNFLASIGIPVLDGLGIDGDGAHADHEHIIVDDIPLRGALLAGLIASL